VGKGDAHGDFIIEYPARGICFAFEKQLSPKYFPNSNTNTWRSIPEEKEQTLPPQTQDQRPGIESEMTPRPVADAHFPL
jgi:hypothetical protein